jgi:hypothetical protein
MREHHDLHWEITRRPKSDADYNLPVIVGFASPGSRLNPLAVSSVIALRMLDESAGPEDWFVKFKVWSGYA